MKGGQVYEPKHQQQHQCHMQKSERCSSRRGLVQGMLYEFVGATIPSQAVCSGRRCVFVMCMQAGEAITSGPSSLSSQGLRRLRRGSACNRTAAAAPRAHPRPPHHLPAPRCALHVLRALPCRDLLPRARQQQPLLGAQRGVCAADEPLPPSVHDGQVRDG